MSGRNISIIANLSTKSLKDTIILLIVAASIVAIMVFVEDKRVMVASALVAFFVYYILYQLTKNKLLLSIDKLIDNELKEFQKISVKVLQLSEKQRQLTNKYIEMLNNVVQTTKMFKGMSAKTKEKT